MTYPEFAKTMPACRADACRQGRSPCPTPQACVLDDERPPMRLGDLLGLVSLMVATWGFCGLVVWLLWFR